MVESLYTDPTHQQESTYIKISNQNASDSDLVHFINIGSTKLRTQGYVFVTGNSQNHFWGRRDLTFIDFRP